MCETNASKYWSSFSVITLTFAASARSASFSAQIMFDVANSQMIFGLAPLPKLLRIEWANFFCRSSRFINVLLKSPTTAMLSCPKFYHDDSFVIRGQYINAFWILRCHRSFSNSIRKVRTAYLCIAHSIEEAPNPVFQHYLSPLRLLHPQMRGCLLVNLPTIPQIFLLVFGRNFSIFILIFAAPKD